jgi:predicted metal-dependent phosphoesterase TrpH
MGLADPHCHTTASDGMVTPAQLVADAVAAGLDAIAITDHDTMANAEEVFERGADAGLGVVRGQEVTTRWPAQTHVLGWFLEHPVRGGMSLEDTVAAIQEQGGLAALPHPFMPTYFASCQPAMLERLIASRHLDAVELVHTAPITPGRLRLLQSFYEAHVAELGAAVGGSDSHFGRHDIGVVVTEFSGRTPDDFRAAVKRRGTRPLIRSRRHVPASLLARQQWRSLVRLPLARLTGQLE